MIDLLKPVLSNLTELLTIQPHRDIIDWASESIDFSDDVSAERKKLDFELSPFLIDPLRAWDFSGRIREVAVCGIEQHGKTLLEVIGVIYNFLDKPCSNLVVYPSDDAAADINKTKYEPLIRRIPELAAELDRPFSVKKDSYIFGGATMFFQGAGRKIMSKSCKIRVLDEEDHYPVIGNLDAGEDTRKRGRSYSESILYRVCTPTTADGPIWKAFLAGSQGYWTLRCQKCGELTIKSCDFSNFQFESEFDEVQGIFVPKVDTIRLICPKCKHEHTERDKRKMNITGGYVHRFPDRLDLQPSFQFGALASQFPFMSWERIAAKILECGKRADITAHYELDNSFKGLPYHEREIATEDLENLKSHFYHDLPKADEVEMVFVVSDTQDTFSPTGVFALDIHDNLWLLKYANIPDLSLNPVEREDREMKSGEKILTVEDWVNEPVRFPGGESITPILHILDYRGHRQQEVLNYAANHRNVRMYAGTSLKGAPWRTSQQNSRMIFADAKTYQVVLIRKLYKQHNKAGAFLFLPDNLSLDVQKEITAMQPDKTRRSGHLFENWKPHGEAVHDAFDVIKMAYFAVDWSIQSMNRSRFRIGKSPMWMNRWRSYNEANTTGKEQPVSDTRKEDDSDSWIRGW